MTINKLMSPVFRTLFIVLLLALLAACTTGDGNPNTDSNPIVEEKAAAVFNGMKSGDYDAVLAQYDDGFFKMQSRDEWREELKRVMAERGPMTEWHLRRSQADTRFSGKFFLYEYETVHDGNKRLHHLMTFLWPVSEDEIILLGHKITPWQAGED